MARGLAHLLSTAIEDELPHLQAVTEADASTKTSTAWSQKEELGHLIDSASNNHLRFVRAALEVEYHGPSYDQNGSVNLHGYQQLAWSNLVQFWFHYNGLLCQLIGRIPEEKLQTPCRVGDGAPVTLQFLIQDYVAHMRHHLDHILRREKVTQYPQPA
jgi:hypothetical protein